MKLIMVLIVMAAALAGVVAGILLAEPTMLTVMDYQNGVIIAKNTQIKEQNDKIIAQNRDIRNQESEIESLNNSLKRINACYSAFKGNANPKTIDRFYNCMGLI